VSVRLAETMSDRSDDGGTDNDMDSSNRSSSDNPDEEVILFPGENDIISSQNRRYETHHGNLMFNLLIATYISDWESARTRSSKIKITKEILQAVKISYGRFLRKRQDDNGWEQLKDGKARDKISHALSRALDKQRAAGTTEDPDIDAIRRHAENFRVDESSESNEERAGRTV
jgi:hypothetical protein